MSLEDDPRWRRFNDRGYTCPCCGQSFDGVFDLHFIRPDVWDGDRVPEPNSAVLDGRDALTEDFCLLGPHRFLRAVLPFPIKGSDTRFSYGVWGSIAEKHFPEIVASFDSGTQSRLGPYFSWLCNALPGCDAGSVECSMHLQDGRLRPVLTIEDPSHPLYAAQRDGISFDGLLDLYARAGTDLRPHLEDH